MKPFLKTSLTVVVTASVTFALTSFLFATGRTEIKIDTGNLSRKINTVNTYLENNYLYDDYDKEKMEEEAVKAYISALDEPYTSYYTKDEFKSYLSGVEESYVGIGIVISVDVDKNKIIVVSPFIDSPAHEAGVKPGDYILGVDDKQYSGEQMNDCVNHIKGGSEGTTVMLRLEREGEILELEVERRQISVESVSSEMMENNIGYVCITAFNTNEAGSEENTFTEFKEHVQKLRDDGMEKMIIDLRDNPGGVLSVVCDIADYMLPEGVITYTETRKGKKDEYFSDSNELDIPMVILINGNSASASEVLAGAMRDYERAVIVGEKSFGKGIVQSIYPFYDGSGMSMTVSKYYSPKGTCIHGVGIEPDHVIEMPEKYKNWYASDVPREEDVQLKKATEVLEEIN